MAPALKAIFVVSDMESMRIYYLFALFLAALSPCWAFEAPDHSQIQYLGESKERFLWHEIKDKHWLDLDLWAKERHMIDENPAWRSSFKKDRPHEMVARAVQCFGSCTLSRGEGTSLLQFRSPIYEGDEISTDADSYLWVFMLDGTMVRLSPESSIAIKELNISSSEIFLHARINYGNIYWLSRESHEIARQKGRETDMLFLPLSFYDANASTIHLEVNEYDLFSIFEGEDEEEYRKYNRLNKLIRENNEHLQNKPTYSYLVMPNGTVYGKNLKMELVVLFGGSAYLKNRSLQRTYKEGATVEEGRPTVFFRGVENRETSEMDHDSWYEVAPDGTEFTQHGQVIERFMLGEFLTKRIPTILTARELMLKKYSNHLFTDIDRFQLGNQFGYRLWDSLDKQKNSDLYQRVEFLKEYTRRLETTQLRISRKLIKELTRHGEKLTGVSYGSPQYHKAYEAYATGGVSQTTGQRGEVLNSTKKAFWRVMHNLK